MPQYALIGTHPPNICPMTNKVSREAAKKAYAQLPALSKELNVKVLLDLHLDPGHKAFMLFEAPSAESVTNLIVRAGFSYFLDFEFYPVTAIAELLKQIDKMPTVF